MQKILNIKNSERGFTLIELLVVIAIIGILSSIILVSLNTARKKGMDGAVKGDLGTIRTQAALDYAGNGNKYGAVTIVAVPSAGLSWTSEPGSTNTPLFGATAATAVGDRTSARALEDAYSNANGNVVKYFASTDAFYTVAQLHYGGFWCVDSNGYGGSLTALPASGATACK